MSSCAPPVGGIGLEGIDVSKETVIDGTVSSGGVPAGGVYVRLLDAAGEFTAEVVTSPQGEFRFFARPGRWTLRALSASGTADAAVTAGLGAPVQVDLTV
ncbi:MAG TPA: DUF1416 domain-containing protein [Mycobacteriales bacterium]|nr:DUF1416 domain-containing protein [Mycobacteriales bacterium]